MSTAKTFWTVTAVWLVSLFFLGFSAWNAYNAPSWLSKGSLAFQLLAQCFTLYFYQQIARRYIWGTRRNV